MRSRRETPGLQLPGWQAGKAIAALHLCLLHLLGSLPLRFGLSGLKHLFFLSAGTVVLMYFAVSGLLLFLQHLSDLVFFPIFAEEPVPGEQPKCVECKANAPTEQRPEEPEDIRCCQHIDEK